MGRQEAKIERYLIQQIKSLGGKSFKFSSPVRKGVPDRICIMPYGLIFFVECKTEKGVISTLQKITFDEFTELHHPVYIVKSKEDVDAFIKYVAARITHVFQKYTEFEKDSRDNSETTVSEGTSGT